MPAMHALIRTSASGVRVRLSNAALAAGVQGTSIVERA